MGRRTPEDRIIATFTRTGARLWGVACASAMFLVGIANATSTSEDWEDSYYGSDSGFAIGSRIFYGAIALSSAFVIVRWFRSGIFATRSGLIVRNLFKTFRISWDEVAGFRRPARYGRMRNAGLGICLRDGSTRFSSLYAAGPFNKESFADEVLERLSEIHAHFGGPQLNDNSSLYD